MRDYDPWAAILNTIFVSGMHSGGIYPLQLGRKPILLIGTVLMFVSHIVSASLIHAYNLEGTALEDFSVSKRVAGYIVVVSVIVFQAGGTISVG